MADASHELRTPLTVMRAQAEFLQRTPDLSASEISRGHQTIVSEVDAMSVLVNDLLLLARADSASLNLERGSHDIAAIARQAFPVVRADGRRSRVTLAVEAPPPVVALIDPDRVQQVIRILLDNAIRHTPHGGRVSASATQSAGKAQVTVSDTGTGINAPSSPEFSTASTVRTRTEDA